jgi:sodium transport system permease protein
MRSPISIVLGKEILDNFRDRRTLFSALVFGPLFGPLLFATLITIMLNQAIERMDESLELPVTGAERAPNLMKFLEQQDIDAIAGPASLEEARLWVIEGRQDLVLVIPESYAAQINQGSPGRLILVMDQANNRAGQTVLRVQNVLRGYGDRLASLRAVARGIHPFVFRPITLDTDDVSTPSGRSVLILGMMTYFLLFSMLMGGMYLAIDTTAGERERNSLEPLLTLPVSRGQLLFGKLGATVFYMLVSLALTLTAFAIAIQFVPLERLGMTASLTPKVVLQGFLILAPFALLGAALMTVVASFTKSYKEAQSYLTVVLLVPTLPIVFAGLFQVKPSLVLMWIPSLSQHLLITSLIKAEPVHLSYWAVSSVSTLVLGVLTSWLAVWLYRRERILG